ncbi:hypothetical protein [Methylomonas albis]|uniref:Uncharacterized protein n=1 Tax=Methylomonas albis TaxID=1854563 RepID=A0ABR9D226_9GAMM|nr:hypothetical protein [Methylomonas albis]MBD9356876.1 hypothetical protein [Methylomonas albis]
MINTKTAKTIAMILAGGSMSLAGISVASASATYYSTDRPIDGSYAPDQYTDAAALGTDGWTRTGESGNSGTPLPWLGTVGGARPFGYVGYGSANWAAEITAAGDSLEISQADAAARYGTAWGAYGASLANIDTAKGAWYDGAQGWGHNTDIGLFKSDVTALVTINLTSLFNDSEPDKSWHNFGVTVFTGMDSSSSGYSRHTGWNYGTDFTQSDPFTSVGVVYDGSIGVSNPGKAYSATVDDVNGYTFLAQAGQVYSIYLGGNSGSGNYDPHAGYQLNITTEAPASVPVPGAVWLFGTVIAGFVATGRRRLKGA